MDIPFIDIHTHRTGPAPDTLRIGVFLLGRGDTPPVGKFVAGIHPWDAGKATGETLSFFDAPPEGLVGIGETGLDFAVDEPERKIQQVWLGKQLALAEKIRLPVVLHCVKAYNEMILILGKYELPGVIFHGFIGSVQLMTDLTARGYYLSFGSRTFRSPKTVEALRDIGADRLFLETDDDPQADLVSLYTETAALKGMSVETLKQNISINYKTVFPNG